MALAVLATGPVTDTARAAASRAAGDARAATPTRVAASLWAAPARVTAPERAAAPARPAPVVRALSAYDARLLRDINHARAARRLRRLVLVAGATDVAHGWSCHMVWSNALAHNPHLGRALEHHGSWRWTEYGENVGVVWVTAGADVLFRAYMNSPEHRANILDPDYRYVGIWSKRRFGTRWNTIDFVGRRASSYDDGYGPTRRRC